MKLEGGQISTSGLSFLLICYIFGSTIIIIPGREAEHNIWLAYIAGMTEGLVFAFIYTTLAQRFPQKTLIEINDLIYGPILGKLISLSYILYFLQLTALILRDFGDFFRGVLMPETPLVVFILFSALLGASAVRNGIEVIARCSIIIGPLAIVTSILVTLMLLPQMKITNILPIGDIPLKDFIKASHSVASVPFGETIAFLMVFAFMEKEKVKNIRKLTLLTIILGSIFLLINIFQTACTLGKTAQITLYPTFTAIRLINIGDVFTRLETLVIFAFLGLGFLKLTVSYYGATLGMAQILKLRSYLPLVLPLGVIIVVTSILHFENTIENIVWTSDIYPYYSIPFQIGIPLLSLLIAMVRKLPKQKTGSKQQQK